MLAHPGQLDSRDIAGDLASCGLSGIEPAHPDHDACDERRVSDAAVAYGLFCTAGSDCLAASAPCPMWDSGGSRADGGFALERYDEGTPSGPFLFMRRPCRVRVRF